MRISNIYCLLVLVVFVSFPSRAKVLTFCLENKTSPPRVMGNSSTIAKPNPGIVVELIQRAVKEMGHKASFKRLPWKRCLRYLKAGKVDGLATASFKKERLRFGHYPMKNGLLDTFRYLEKGDYSLYHLKGTPPGWDGKTLSIKGTVGVELGYSIVRDLKKRGVHVSEASLLGNFRKLQTRRLAYVATITSSGDLLLASGRFPNLEKVSPPLTEKKYYVLLSHQLVRRERNLSETFWNTLSKVRDLHFTPLIKKYQTLS